MGNLEHELETQIIRFHQEHLLNFIDELDDAQFANYEKQLSDIDWNSLDSLIKEYVFEKAERNILADISPAPYYAYPTKDEKLLRKYENAIFAGEKLIRDGKLALLTVAGGQGTRLGFDGPKGTYPISPVAGKSFFQYFSETIIGANKKYNVKLNWLIMTSPANNQDTVNFFVENNFFGLDKEFVHFFVQGTMPAISFDGKLIMESKSSLALSPDGHGGTIKALHASGFLDILEKRGVEFLSYFQIDNLIVPPLDTLFIGLHKIEESELSSRMLAKTGPMEKLGNFCVSDGKLNIIEYSDMPRELAEQHDENGRLSFIAGSPAIHIFSVSFLKRLCDSLSLPLHRAEKKVNFVTPSGTLVKPKEPNAVKLETFIFDSLPFAKRTMILEAVREEQFSPTKNPEGVDSVQSARKMLSERDAKRLEAVGIFVPRKNDGSLDCTIELSPLKFYSPEDLAMRKSELTPPKRGEMKYYE